VETVIEKLTEAHRDFAHWHGKSPPTKAPGRTMLRDDYREYERAVGRAIRAGVTKHPLVADWIRARRSVGDYNALRRFRLGLEAGMEPEIDEADLWIALKAADLIDEGKSLEVIRGRLLGARVGAPKEIRPLIASRLGSKQNLQRRLGRLGIQAGRKDRRA
jgi:hypothetical protein